MTVPGPGARAPHLSVALLRRLRLGSGLVLLGYLVTHFANHALGLVSLDAMEAGREWFLAFWRSGPASLLLYGSLLAHFGLALLSLYRRRHLRMPAWEAAQLVLGLAIPPLLASHIVSTRLASELASVHDSYSRVTYAYWMARPDLGVRQTAVLIVAWLHGCIGLHFWLRLMPWYPRAAPLLFSGAILLPVLALLGFAHGGREAGHRAREPGWIERTMAPPADPITRAWLERAPALLVGGFALAVAGVLVGRAVRQRRRRGAIVRIGYPGGREVAVPLGFSVLEASRRTGIPHASVCGGRGRCSTCRVRIVTGLAALPPASADERRVLRRRDLPPNVRLACQLRPTADVSVVPLLPAAVSGSESGPGAEGREREIAVLFADLRGFTQLAERKLPYDVVFILNRYFEAVGATIARAGGVANQFTGDGVMALFGTDTTPADACRQAVIAAGDVVTSVAELSLSLAEELAVPLRLGIGIHTGPAVVGKMGYGEGVYLTAVGDTVNAAARLEELTKTYGCDLVISEPVALRAGLDVSGYPRHELLLRNRLEPLAIRVIPDARQLAASLGSVA